MLFMFCLVNYRHKRRLSLYGNIVRNDCIERELAYRQLAVKESTSKSWFVALQEVLYKYDLPTAQELLDNPPEKLAWKVLVRRHVNERWAGSRSKINAEIPK